MTVKKAAEPVAAKAREEVVFAAAERAYDTWRNRPNRAAYVREALLDAATRAYDARED